MTASILQDITLMIAKFYMMQMVMMTLKAMTRLEQLNQDAESFILISAANYMVPWLPSASSP
jgi:hypothetical protein